jgi:hypothetical protein
MNETQRQRGGLSRRQFFYPALPMMEQDWARDGKKWTTRHESAWEEQPCLHWRE